MNALAITIPVTLLLVAVFVGAFIYAARRDQFEDLVTPAHRILIDDDETQSLTQRKEEIDVREGS